jgi:hypothetical protein
MLQFTPSFIFNQNSQQKSVLAMVNISYYGIIFYPLQHMVMIFVG